MMNVLYKGNAWWWEDWQIWRTVQTKPIKLQLHII